MASGSSKEVVGVYSKENGLPWGFNVDAGKVWLVGSSNGSSIRIALGSTLDNVLTNILDLTTTTSRTGAIISAPGASTSIQLRGFSVCNYGTNRVFIELREGTTAFWRGSLPGGSDGGGAFNWNMVGQYKQLAANKKLVIYMAGASTTAWSAWYKLN